MTVLKLSVIVPFYDEFAYMERCLGSLLAAGDVISEILIVNDAASPEAAALLASFEKIKKLRILHNDHNVGAGESRNRGIAAAIGDYVMFLDADDLVSPAGLRELWAFAQSTKAEIVHVPSLVYEPSAGRWWKFFRDEAYFGRRRRYTTLEDLPELRYAAANWSLLFDRALLSREHVRFDPEQRVAEDHLFLIKALQPAQRIATFDRWCHLWRRRGGSLSQSDTRLETHRVKLASIKKSLAFMERHYSVEDIAFQRDYVFGLLRLISGWDFISDLLTRRDEPGVETLLDELASLCADYALQEGIEDDWAVRRMAPDKTLRNSSGKILDWHLLPAIHAAIAHRDWRSLEEWFLSESRPPLHLPIVKGMHDVRPLNRNADLNPGLGKAGAQALVRSCDVGAIRLILDDPLAAMCADYRGRIAKGDRRAFNQFIMDEADSFALFPGQVLAAAQAAGVKVSVVLDPQKNDISVPLRPDVERMDDPAVPQELRDAIATLHRVICERLSPGVKVPDMVRLASEATRAMILDRWQQDLGLSAKVPAVTGPILTRGILGLIWQINEATLPAPQQQPQSFLKLLDTQRFGDGGPDGRRTVKRRLKQQLGRLRNMIADEWSRASAI